MNLADSYILTLKPNKEVFMWGTDDNLAPIEMVMLPEAKH